MRYLIIRNIFLFISFSLFLTACSSSKEENKELKTGLPTYKKIAEEKFKNDYKVESNSDSTYLIVYYSPKNKLRSLNPPLKFFVYNTGDKKVIFQDNLANGKVKWKNKSQFIVTTIPEIVKGNEAGDIQNFGYTYDVISRRKLTGFDQNK
jgi:hypothetical protein